MTIDVNVVKARDKIPRGGWEDPRKLWEQMVTGEVLSRQKLLEIIGSRRTQVEGKGGITLINNFERRQSQLNSVHSKVRSRCLYGTR